MKYLSISFLLIAAFPFYSQSQTSVLENKFILNSWLIGHYFGKNEQGGENLSYKLTEIFAIN